MNGFMNIIHRDLVYKQAYLFHWFGSLNKWDSREEYTPSFSAYSTATHTLYLFIGRVFKPFKPEKSLWAQGELGKSSVALVW